MTYFTGIQNEIIKRIRCARNSILIAVTWFTNKEIFDALLSKLDEGGINVALIVLNDRINNKREGLNYQDFIDKGGRFFYSSTDRMVHHKFCILDGQTVITGSYNWTYYSESRNWENIVILDNTEIAQRYCSEFFRICSSHLQITDIASSRMTEAAFTANEYLSIDYSIQANIELENGNMTNAAKIYSEISRISDNSVNFKAKSEGILKEVNNNGYEIAPFEIGLIYHNGYRVIAKQFQQLPIETKEIFTNPFHNQNSVEVKVVKGDPSRTAILQFTVENIKPHPVNIAQFEIAIRVKKSGIVTATFLELNGYKKRRTEYTNLENFL